MLPSPDNSAFALEWWADGGLLASGISSETSDGFAFLCEACGFGLPWAAKYFPNRALIKFYSACRNHDPKRLEIPGSLILWFAKDELERMPDVLVEREFNVHLAYYIKESQRETFQSGDTRSKAVPNPRIDTSGILAELEGGPGEGDFASA